MSVKSIISKIIRGIPLLITIAIGVPVTGMALSEGGKLLGLKPVVVEVVGTGSMYPSLFWDSTEGGPEKVGEIGIEEYRSSPLMYKKFAGLNLFGQTYLKRTINYGDMVAFKSDVTRKVLEEEGKDQDAGFIKRVIAVAGDTIELKDGYVIKNGELLNEPYIYRPRSSYGGSTLPDCKMITIPDDHYFVLGDNRKVSSDSRFDLGLIKESDIAYVLPYSEQEVYRPLWRDTSKDNELIGTSTLSVAEFYKLVADVRSQAKQGTLKPSPALARSTALRGAKLLSEKETTYSMQQAMIDAGYSNVVVGEFVSYGNFTAQELLQNLLAFADTAKQLTNSNYQDIAVTATNREIEGCPKQVIVGHLGGYIPATYESHVVESWQKLRTSLAEIIPSWEAGVGQEGIDQAKVVELLTILRRRLALADEVLSTMQKREWLSDGQKARIEQDNQDADQAEKLATELNSR